MTDSLGQEDLAAFCGAERDLGSIVDHSRKAAGTVKACEPRTINNDSSALMMSGPLASPRPRVHDTADAKTRGLARGERTLACQLSYF
jgi:hypothetical protein